MEIKSTLPIISLIFDFILGKFVCCFFLVALVYVSIHPKTMNHIIKNDITRISITYTLTDNA